MSVFQRRKAHDTSSNDKNASANVVESAPDTQPHNPYTEIQVLQCHSDIVRLLMKIDERRCVSAGDDNKAVIWDIQSGHKLCVLTGHARPITCMLLLEPQFDIDFDCLLLTGSSDRQIRAWDIQSGECLQVLSEHNSSVKSLVSLSNSDIFCSGGSEVCAWDHGGKLLCRYSHTEEEDDICLMIAIRNDRIVTAADKQLVVYAISIPQNSELDDAREITQVKKLPPHREAVRSLINISEGSFASGSIDGTIILWTTQTLLPSRYFNTVKEYQGSDHMYPYSIQHMTCEEERFVFAAVGSGFQVYDMASGQLVAERTAAHYSKVLRLGFVFDGSLLATCSEDGTIRLWGNSKQKALSQDAKQQASEAQKPVERFLGVSASQMKQGVSAVMRPALLGECAGHSGAVQMFADYDYNGLVSCGVDSLVVVWKNAHIQRLSRHSLAQEIVMGAANIV